MTFSITGRKKILESPSLFPEAMNFILHWIARYCFVEIVFKYIHISWPCVFSVSLTDQHIFHRNTIWSSCSFFFSVTVSVDTGRNLFYRNVVFIRNSVILFSIKSLCLNLFSAVILLSFSENPQWINDMEHRSGVHSVF